MDFTPKSTISTHFASLEDPRIDRRKKHLLIDIVVIAICAIICGADSWTGVQAFGDAKFNWLSTFLKLENGIPSHDTFGRVFAALDSEQFETCFVSWISAVSQLTKGEVIAIDGKTARRSYDSDVGKTAIHLVSAWSSANGITLGQVKVDDKSNEIVAIPKLLEMLDISGCLVTIDAMGCQRDIAEKIVGCGGDYLLTLKGNQGTLFADVSLLFNELDSVLSDGDVLVDTAQSVDGDHGRIETRRATVITDSQLIAPLRGSENFKGLSSLIEVVSRREVGDEMTVTNRYFISSCSLGAQQLLNATRTHWQIENCCHWVLDMAFREDECRIRKDNGAQNFAILRRIAANLLKSEDSVKLGIKNKRLLAGWDNNYLLTVLSTLLH